MALKNATNTVLFKVWYGYNIFEAQNLDTDEFMKYFLLSIVYFAKH
jgi:hypothetical protein